MNHSNSNNNHHKNEDISKNMSKTNHNTNNNINRTSTSTATSTSSFWGLQDLLENPSTVSAVSCYFIVSLVCIIYDETFSLWCIASSESGGLGFSIGLVGEVR